ncbi:hypothetical protein [Pelagicoccus sp. SDUM812002]|uniref:hypothetical protein n=1 Tax=Pelagicoccus sp. SDUM812002 TaxID=3041266 RepID=UPI00280CF706|nr:hypothetical protein [Pelagicoccus sp. SDUM812002]MDQ8187813.1 hypothetical protein [Pelagicoccus sp. SDUM812002]
MSATSSDTPSSLKKFLPHAWWIALVIAFAIHWTATERRIDRVLEISSTPTWSADRPEIDPQSPTGFEHGQRSLIIPGHHNASYFWIIEAQEAAHTGNLRIREVTYDAMPDGRTIDRTSPYRLWLISVGWLHSLANGESLGYSIERGTLWADPALLALMLVFGSVYSARYFGSLASVGYSLACVSIFPLAANFQPGAPDPHSLSWVLALAGILPLLAALQENKRIGRPNLHFVCAGAISGLGVWTDASSGMPVLLSLFLGGLASEFLRSREHATFSPRANGWRVWGSSAAAVILMGGLFEKLPEYLSLSLNSVNPIQALIALGFGEFLRNFSLLLKHGRSGLGKVSLTLLGMSSLALLIWPIVGAISESGSLLAADFYARELANHPNGTIASSLGTWINEKGQGAAKFTTLLPAALVFVAGLRMVQNRSNTARSTQIALALVAVLLALILGYFELRWWNLFNAFSLALVVSLLADAKTWKQSKLLPRFAILLLLVPGLLLGYPETANGSAAENLSQSDKQALVGRDYSYWLNERRGEDTPVVLSTHIFSNLLAYYGGFGTILSSDDGYEEGYRSAVRILSTNTIQEATILLNDKGITHIVLPLWDPILDRMVQVGTGVDPGEILPPSAFAVSLREWDFPLWLQPLAYSTPKTGDFASFEIRSFALGPEQEEELRLSRLADLFVEGGESWSYRAMREGLKAYPRSPAALGAIANIELASQNRVALEETLETLIPYLSRRSARNLPTDRRVSLAILLARTKRIELAKEQLSKSMENLDTDTLRFLTPNTVASLVLLSRSLDVQFPNDETIKLANELLPPDIREQLASVIAPK